MIQLPVRQAQPARPAETALSQARPTLESRIAPHRDKQLDQVGMADPLRNKRIAASGSKPVQRALEASARIRADIPCKCCWCERYVSVVPDVRRADKLSVEHFRPRSMYPWLQLDWDNLLASCAACNHDRGARARGQDDFPIRDGVTRLCVGGSAPGVAGCELDGAEEGWLLVDPMSATAPDPASLVQARIHGGAYRRASFPSRAALVVRWQVRDGASRRDRERARTTVEIALSSTSDIVLEQRANWIRTRLTPRFDGLLEAHARSDQSGVCDIWATLSVFARPEQEYSLVAWEMMSAELLEPLRRRWRLDLPPRPNARTAP